MYFSSHPARGAWIEIVHERLIQVAAPRRTPQGVRGLKYVHLNDLRRLLSRTPQGVRGLKLDGGDLCAVVPGRTPQGVRGLKCPPASCCTADLVAPRKGCVD